MNRIPMRIQAQCMQLANEIDYFSYDCSPSLYTATDEERQDNINDIAYDIAKGNVKYLSDYIELEKKQKAYYHMPTFVQRADKILSILESFSRPKSKS